MVDRANTWVSRGGHIYAALDLRICHYQVVFCNTDVSISLFEYVKWYKGKPQTTHKVKVTEIDTTVCRVTAENLNGGERRR
jgi:hypothetical protein